MARPKIELTEEEILEVIKRHNGSLQDAARELDISPSTLGLRLRELGYERVVRWVKAIA